MLFLGCESDKNDFSAKIVLCSMIRSDQLIGVPRVTIFFFCDYCGFLSLFVILHHDVQVQANIYLLDFHKREGDQFTFMVSIVAGCLPSDVLAAVLFFF